MSDAYVMKSLSRVYVEIESGDGRCVCGGHTIMVRMLLEEIVLAAVNVPAPFTSAIITLAGTTS
jgi:hypothetical protein